MKTYIVTFNEMANKPNAPVIDGWDPNAHAIMGHALQQYEQLVSFIENAKDITENNVGEPLLRLLKNSAQVEATDKGRAWLASLLCVSAIAPAPAA